MGSAPNDIARALAAFGFLLLAGCGGTDGTDAQAASNVQTESHAQVTFQRIAEPVLNAQIITAPMSFEGYARQVRDPVTGNWNPEEIRLYLSDTTECGGDDTAPHALNFDIHAYANDGGARPGVYSFAGAGENSNPAVWASWSFEGYASAVLQTGTITLTRVDQNVVEGSFLALLEFEDGSQYSATGKFTAPLCGS